MSKKSYGQLLAITFGTIGLGVAAILGGVDIYLDNVKPVHEAVVHVLGYSTAIVVVASIVPIIICWLED